MSRQNESETTRLENALAELLGDPECQAVHRDKALTMYMGRGKTWHSLKAAEVLWPTACANAPSLSYDDEQAAESARERFRSTAERLREATTPAERRVAARAFLAALAELVACLLRFLVAVLLLLLSRLQGSATADELPTWKPDPIETAPQIAPPGPNPAFPVHINRGGHRRSALGSAVLAA